jgi:hypothetical protein
VAIDVVVAAVVVVAVVAVAVVAVEVGVAEVGLAVAVVAVAVGGVVATSSPGAGVDESPTAPVGLKPEHPASETTAIVAVIARRRLVSIPRRAFPALKNGLKFFWGGNE